ncbi:Helix-turn-helix domain protein [Streptomyces rimosus subsp. rimosus]|uniref:Helix-turn-helix domain protein n=1 Tax=Streptomyces rimosus subsp. rimosus TaxID=132474 RepID=A0ABY3ZBW3_STRRM|nr:Helix-turn-helix domain protein [Streptomyces rimosus subsp. rimosus]UTH97390.1 Helix-turn-helix domain protein [Streptomyces rimosus subsp. rimosus]UTJ15488.1 Helix-turn-helix domain protein [Streptomyces rimosus subsp. rimosus]
MRIAARPDVLWETVLSFHRLRDRRPGPVFGKWRAEARSRLNGETRLLAPLVPTRGYFPDFLTPAEGLLGVDEGLEAVRATPPARLHAELSRLPATRPLPSWLRALSEGDSAALGRLTGALQSYYENAVAPYWPRLQARIEADRAARGRALLDGGADHLLATLPPTMRWRPPVLEVDYPADRDLFLNGRGLLLLPSFFCRRTPVTFYDPDLTPVLVYPVEHPAPRLVTPAAPVHASLGKLVGRTRSAILHGVGGGCTTSELARRVDVSLASASQHATVLRDAGLLLTLRHGNAVLHTLTPLGAALLRGGPEVDVRGVDTRGLEIRGLEIKESEELEARAMAAREMEAREVDA